MKLHARVEKALEDIDLGHFDAAMTHALIAVDGSAGKKYPQKKSGPRFIQYIRDYIWIIEYFMCQGIDLENTKFENVVGKKGAPDFAELIYEVYRCAHAHGDEIPAEFEVLPAVGPYGAEWKFEKGSVRMPSRIVYALLGSVVFANINKDIKSSGPHWLSWSIYKFTIKDWWGREQDLESILSTEPRFRVKLEGLGNIVSKSI